MHGKNVLLLLLLLPNSQMAAGEQEQKSDIHRDDLLNKVVFLGLSLMFLGRFYSWHTHDYPPPPG